MSMTKDQVEWMQLYAQKCDHRAVGPGPYFDIAADLRGRKGRGGKLFEKQKDHSDKFVVDEDDVAQQLYVRKGATPFSPGLIFGVELRTPKKDISDDSGVPQSLKDEQAGDDSNMTNAERLQKLYRVLGYIPDEWQQPPPQPARVPRIDLKTAPLLPSVSAQNFNRNAKGWTAQNVSKQDADQALQPVRPSTLPAFAPRDGSGEQHMGYSQDYKGIRPKSWPSSLLELYIQQKDPMYANYNAKQRGWQPVYFEDARQKGQVPYGDYNPRPHPWLSTLPEEDEKYVEEVQYGDYNPRPKAWESSGLDDFSLQHGELQYGDYNARPKAWHGSNWRHHSPPPEVHYGDYNARPRVWVATRLRHRVPPNEIRPGDFNARPRLWETSRREHYEARPQPKGIKAQFRDYNARAKAWESARAEHNERLVANARHGDYNPRPKAWQTAEWDDSDSSSFSSWTSIDSDHYRNVFRGRLVLGSNV